MEEERPVDCRGVLVVEVRRRARMTSASVRWEVRNFMIGLVMRLVAH